ncbi:hypothetical protein A2954_01320 [Candidatus Roizmanbacteria bacterium RIFCSPLOWO2_01_FULL_37_12]|uniref:Uncharacterized protein n=1 Tax=Candidatus Roizmanbacteria bacterium RIFCSPLOWO2_01_FULL_37_12 TaxID=1802056 RepID=A0A1F7IGJ7_9BACT|nr:MAG: hypothetical protein A3D76_05970 [Candidatus Roizmanbacteria bacterium RIFCSPHIGHO2_02_FULL_37_9b]OGK42465.1 MAG: hypothetical protein A2954_01320 [Candidatus Roizmanbacteria bacterium RIFCSPLOWO2_01_FULL_37_12]
MIDNVVHSGETVVKSIEHVLTSPANLQPALDYIEKHKPTPISKEWTPTPNSQVFSNDNFWIVRQVRPEPEVRNKTDLYIGKDGQTLYVLWSELDNNPHKIEQLSAMITKDPTNGSVICLDGELNGPKKYANPTSTVQYINTLLTYSF